MASGGAAKTGWVSDAAQPSEAKKKKRKGGLRNIKEQQAGEKQEQSKHFTATLCQSSAFLMFTEI